MPPAEPATNHVVRVDPEVYAFLEAKRTELAAKGHKPSFNAAIRALLPKTKNRPPESRKRAGS